jgi:ABC-type glycerol-3-phosphate transport system substrate-binding protein
MGMKKMSLMAFALLLGATVSVCSADAFTSKKENMLTKITDKVDGTSNPKAKEFAKKKIDCVKAAKDEAGLTECKKKFPPQELDALAK